MSYFDLNTAEFDELSNHPATSIQPSMLWSVLIKAVVLSLGRNEPLKKDKPKWKSDYPMTEGQLRSKRDEFWDTAPAFDGRKEIWDALKAAAVVWKNLIVFIF